MIVIILLVKCQLTIIVYCCELAELNHRKLKSYGFFQNQNLSHYKQNVAWLIG
jgi:hypothetical protein